MKVAYKTLLNNIILCDLQVDTTAVTFFITPWKQRLIELENVLKELNNLLSPNSAQPHIRAIVTAPEYFFASSADKRYRHYSESEKDNILESIKKLSSANPGVLIIPGTIAWHQPAQDPVVRSDSSLSSSSYAPVPCRSNVISEQKFFENNDRIGKQVSKNDYYNYNKEFADTRAMVAKERMTMGQQGLTCYDRNVTSEGNYAIQEEYKRALSNPQYLHLAYNSAYFFLNGRQKHQYDKVAGFEEASLSSVNVYTSTNSSPIVKIDNIRFGIEICFDHNRGVLKQFYANHAGYIHSDITTPPDVHLILSAYVENNHDNICVKNNGYFVHSSSNSNSRRSQKNINSEFSDIPDVSVLNNLQPTARYQSSSSASSLTPYRKFQTSDETYSFEAKIKLERQKKANNSREGDCCRQM